MIRRRDFLTLVVGAGVTATLLHRARAQQGRLPTIGLLVANTIESTAKQVVAYKVGLQSGGFSENQNVKIEYRYAESQASRLPTLLNELIAARVQVIVMVGVASYVGAGDLFRAAAGAQIPVVSIFGGDPQALGFVESLSHPGGNLTGVSQLTGELEGKRLSLLHDLAPAARNVGMLVNPSTVPAAAGLRNAQDAAAKLGIGLIPLNASSMEEIRDAFDQFARLRPDALQIGASPFFNGQRNLIVPLVERLGVPAIYEFRDFAVAGGLATYGTDLDAAWGQLGDYTAQVLKGANPADLPVAQSTKFELVINLKTAKVLGLKVPPSMLAIATEVIQ